MSGSRLLLTGFDGHVAAALAGMGHPPALWLRKGAVGAGETAPGGGALADLADLSRMRFKPEAPDLPGGHAIRRAVCEDAREHYRRSCDRQTSFTPANSWTTYDHRLALLVAWHHAQIERLGLDTVIFSNIPHEPSMLPLYHLARRLGMRTIITAQSLFSDRFFMFEHTDDFGAFATAAASDAPPPPMPDAPTSPFYMGRRYARQRERGAVTNLFRRIELFGSVLGRAAALSFGGDPRRLIKALGKLGRLDDTRRLHAERFVDTPPLDVDFIYAPLHLQPELTVDVIGGPYGDQALMIEELSAAAPRGWLIYVKENPKQTALAREKEFFQRLKLLDNVRLVSSEMDTFSLIKNARCVATPTGTAGWEALVLGKPAIAFGLAWWRRLPGAVEWRDGVDFDAIRRFSFDRAQLERAFADLGRRMRAGVVDPAYVEATPGFEPVENSRKVAAALAERLETA